MSDVADYTAELARRPAARAPASFGEIWSSEWSRAGLDTLGGVGKPMFEAYDELFNAVQTAHGRSLGELARERNYSIANFDTRVETLGRLLDELPEETRKPLEPLKDVRGRASDKARAIERSAEEVSGATYGLSGNALAFLAGIARQMSDPVNIAANVATAPVGGPFKGPLFAMLGRQAAAGGLAQALVEPAIEAAREELGLEAGFARGARNVAETALGSAGLAGLLRLGAAGVRVARRRFGGDLPEEHPAGALATEDIEAAAKLAERERLIDAQVLAQAPASYRGNRLEAIAAALEEARPAVAPAIVPVGEPRQLVRPGGGRFEVRPAIVELDQVTISHDLAGSPNPAYPAELQPRDRAAPASRSWVAEKSAALEPELLGDAPTAALGAPVVGPDGIVESGNGRMLLLASAYERHPERAAAYRAFLEQQGYDVAELKRPVLVRVREGELALPLRAALASEANVSPTAGLSVRERAFADAKVLDEGLLAAYRGGDLGSAENAPFVRAFADRAVAAEERPQFVGADDRLSADGARRLEAAMVAKAWDADIARGQQPFSVVAALYESADPSSKAILGAMADVAPAVARLRAAVAEGRVPAAADPVPALLEAFRLVERARSSGLKVADLVDQADIERGVVPQAVRDAVRLYFRDDALRQAAGRDAVAARIEQATARALVHENAVADLFGVEPTVANVLQGAQLAGVALDEQSIAGAGRAELLRMIDNKAPAADIARHPVVLAAVLETRSRPHTNALPGYGTPAFQAARAFDFAGERVTGYAAALDRLTDQARGFAGGAVRAERTAIVVVGPPASGKSQLAEHYAREYGAALVDPDEVKPTLPEYAGGIGASAVHEEASALAGSVLERLAGQGANLVLPKVGAEPAKMRAIVEALAGLGYRVGLVNMVVDQEEAYRRMIRRFLTTGRVVASDYFEGVGTKPRETYNILKKEGRLFDAAEIDNNGQAGKVVDGSGELAQRSGQRVERRDAGGPGAGESQAQRQQPEEAKLGDPVKAQEFERVLEELGDVELVMADGSKRSARAALADAQADARAAAELEACIGEAAAEAA